MKRYVLTLLLATAIISAAVSCGGDDEGGGGMDATKQAITIGWGAEPPSLDPGLATDTTSSNVLLAIMDPLVKLNPETNEAEPALAESWDVSEDGVTVTYHLRSDGKWTNGDPVTAGDFEYSWKRTLSPELAADYAYQLYGIKGGAEYNSCEKNCDAMADKVGVKAVDDRTLEVTLTSAQPWFIQQSAHHSFLAVHQATVEQFGDKWTEPENIVTNGPFKLESWEHEATINLVKNEDWRDVDSVSLSRIDGKIIANGTTRVQAFEAGEVDALDGGGLPPDEIARLKETPEYELYPAVGIEYYGFNLKNLPDVHQRRALSLAINRREIIDQIAQADQIPATGMSPQGISGFDTINPNSPWTPETADLEQAQAELDRASSPETDLTLFFNNSPGHKEIATAVQAQWDQLGISTTLKQQEWAQFLEFLGPPPNSAVDVYRLGWIWDFPDAINGLELWACDSGNNNTNYCDKAFDDLVAEAKATEDTAAREELYGQLEDMLFGQNGALPITPIYWYTYPNLEKESIKETFFISPLDQIDFTKVVVQ